MLYNYSSPKKKERRKGREKELIEQITFGEYKLLAKRE